MQAPAIHLYCRLSADQARCGRRLTVVPELKGEGLVTRSVDNTERENAGQNRLVGRAK